MPESLRRQIAEFKTELDRLNAQFAQVEAMGPSLHRLNNLFMGLREQLAQIIEGPPPPPEGETP
jgi:glutaredoxin-related protein